MGKYWLRKMYSAPICCRTLPTSNDWIKYISRLLIFVLLLSVMVIKNEHISQRLFLQTNSSSVLSSLIDLERVPCTVARTLPDKKVAILSASTPPNNKTRCLNNNVECSYAFYLPLTALAWKRLGYSTAILIVGDEKPWKESGTHLNYVYKTLVGPKINAEVFFFNVPADLQTGLAQVGRLFVPDMEPFSNEPDTFMVTSDADLLPVIDIYSLPSSGVDDIRVTALLPDRFNHSIQLMNIRMLGMSSIGMRVSTWHSVMKYRQLSDNPDPLQRIKDGILAEFGHLPYNARRGPVEEWYYDQKMISVYFHKWQKSYSNENCSRVSFEGPTERWDRTRWPVNPDDWINSGRVDAHGPLPGHRLREFAFFQPFAQRLLGDLIDVTGYWYNFMSRIDPTNATGALEFASLDEALTKMESLRKTIRKNDDYIILHDPETGE